MKANTLSGAKHAYGGCAAFFLRVDGICSQCYCQNVHTSSIGCFTLSYLREQRQSAGDNVVCTDDTSFSVCLCAMYPSLKLCQILS